MNIVVHIMPNEKGDPPAKLADAELHFIGGELDGLKLIGFAVWQREEDGGEWAVTLPARLYGVNGERRTVARLRAVADVSAQNRIRDLVLQAYADYDDRHSVAFNS
jgi:hypothetical protein